MKVFILLVGLIGLSLPGLAQTPDPAQAPASNVVTPTAAPIAQYVPITPEQRVSWALQGALSPKGIGAGLINASFQTLTNSPEEWGPHWDGFGKRFATRQAQILMQNSIESGLGAIWGEDPRYHRSGREGVGPRLKWALSSAFLTYRRDGTRDIAYARFVGIVSSRAISSTWRPESDKVWYRNSVQPFGTGIAFRCVSNIAREFMPDILRKFRKK